MSSKEVPRAGLLKAALAGRITNAQGARALRLSVRQFRRLKRRFREHGARGLLHALRGRPSNRRLAAPTREQIGREPGLDFVRSRSLGGAELTATLRGADGRSLGRVNYSYYAPTLHLASQAAEAWADARISIQRFATQVAAKLKAAG